MKNLAIISTFLIILSAVQSSCTHEDLEETVKQPYSIIYADDGETVLKVYSTSGKQAANLAPYFCASLEKELAVLFAQKDDNGNLLYRKKDGSLYNIYKDDLRIYTTINPTMQNYAEKALQRHLKEDLQPQFDKNNASSEFFPFVKGTKMSTVDNSLNRAKKYSDRYEKLIRLGYSDKEIENNFSTPVQMKVFSWNGEIDTILSPNDSIRYYKSILRAGLLSIDPRTGYVKAWVGGVDFKHFPYDNVKQSKKQVGSTIYPFIYASALGMRVITPCSEFQEEDYCIETFGPNNEPTGKPFCPRGKEAKNVKSGLAESSIRTTTAVLRRMGGYKPSAQTGGPFIVKSLLNKCDIHLIPEDVSPAMCSGVMDLSLYELVGGQSVFVNNGVYVRPTSILRIEDGNGNVIYNANLSSQEVLDSSSAHTTLNMMKGVVEFGTGASLRSTRKWGGLHHPMAGKTGTTQNSTDGWFMGLTPDLVTGVWVGSEDRDVHFRTMLWGQGARMALPVYGYYMQSIYADPKIKISIKDFVPPNSYDSKSLECSGKLNKF